MKTQITEQICKTHFAVQTDKHDGSGEPSGKLIPNEYREVVQSLIYANAAVAKCAEMQETLDSIPTNGYVVSFNTRQNLLNQEREAALTLQHALARFLMQELNWSKWDCRTEWYFLLSPAMLALGKCGNQFEIPNQDRY